MTDNVEPPTEIAVAVEEKEKTTEESTSTMEAPESASTEKTEASNPATEGGEDTKPKEKNGTAAAAEEAPGSAVESEQNGVTNSEANEGDVKTEKTSTEKQKEEKPEGQSAAAPVVSSSKLSRPPYKYDPDKITLRFLFANRDGLTVTVGCTPRDTVGEVKGALLSVWPEALPNCSGGDRIRLICMGKGILMPDTRTLEDCQVPVFKTHPTPINVSVRPESSALEAAKGGADDKGRRATSPGGASGGGGNQTNQGCACVIL